MSLFEELLQSAATHRDQPVRVAAFGSSNTERFNLGMHWFDYIEMGFNNRFGADAGLFLNAGVGGNTSSQLLARLDRDIASFRPHLTIVTCGGNDANPAREISRERFAANLRELARRLNELGSRVIFQTYYACDLEMLEPAYAENIPLYMQLIREAAAATGSGLQDNFARWELLRRNDPALYRLLMIDALHVNPDGNMVIGLDWMRRLELPLLPEKLAGCATGLWVRKLLDVMAARA